MSECDISTPQGLDGVSETSLEACRWLWSEFEDIRDPVSVIPAPNIRLICFVRCTPIQSLQMDIHVQGNEASAPS
jgi:hypothetical protein